MLCFRNQMYFLLTICSRNMSFWPRCWNRYVLMCLHSRRQTLFDYSISWFLIYMFCNLQNLAHVYTNLHKYMGLLPDVCCYDGSFLVRKSTYNLNITLHNPFECWLRTCFIFLLCSMAHNTLSLSSHDLKVYGTYSQIYFYNKSKCVLISLRCQLILCSPLFVENEPPLKRKVWYRLSYSNHPIMTREP